MSTLRKQTIISTLFILMGFVFGAINLYFYISKGSSVTFTDDEVGLTKIFFDFSSNATTFAVLGFLPVIYKFFPYYKDNLKKKDNDLLTIALCLAIFGFIVLCILGYLIEPVIIRKYSARSKLIVDYYHLLFPFALGSILFSVIEAFMLSLRKSVYPNFLKETLFRFLNLIFILLFYFHYIDYKTFIYLFTTQFFVIFILLLAYLIHLKEFNLRFKISKVTKKYWKKMLSMQMLIYSGTVIMTISLSIDSFFIAGLDKKALASVAYFMVAQYGGNLINVPQKSITAASIGILAQEWKDKNFTEINRIYSRSCINLSLMALFIFGNIWLNIKPGFQVANINSNYEMALSTLFIIGIARTVDASTGLNNIIIGTSTFWKFDFISGMILLAVRLPVTWYLIKTYGFIGAAIGDLISMCIYNFIRFEFLRRKFNMQPFTYKNILAVLLAVISYFIAFCLCINLTGFVGIIIRALVFSAAMLIGIFTLNLTPDARQLWDRWILKIKH